MTSKTNTTEEAGGANPYLTETHLPQKISELRQKLYGKAKAEPKFRFYALYDRIYRLDVLRAAFAQVAANDGAPGVDGMSVADVHAREGGMEQFLLEIQEELRTKTYEPEAVRRCYIPKPDGRQRPLGIPTVKDRVVQMATLLVLEPIFEADFLNCSFGFRPGRSAHDAIRVIERDLRQGKSAVVDADLKSYFDTIPHDKLMKCVERRITDRAALGLIRMWLHAPIEEPPDDPTGKPRRHRPTSGTPQGGVISPLLANLYLHWLDVPFHGPQGPGSFARATLVRYADDFVILARYVKGRVVDWTRQWIEGRLGLQLNAEKTRILRVDWSGESLDFLGFTFQWRRDRFGSTRKYLHLGPSSKALQRARDRIRERTAPRWGLLPIREFIRRLNVYLCGWAHYFSLGYPAGAYESLNAYVRGRVIRHLRRRSQRPYRPPKGRTWYQHLHRDLGLLRLTVARGRT